MAAILTPTSQAMNADEMRVELARCEKRYVEALVDFKRTHDKYEYFELSYWLGRKHAMESALEGKPHPEEVADA